jgi:hypothetical protein
MHVGLLIMQFIIKPVFAWRSEFSVGCAVYLISTCQCVWIRYGFYTFLNGQFRSTHAQFQPCILHPYNNYGRRFYLISHVWCRTAQFTFGEVQRLSRLPFVLQNTSTMWETGTDVKHFAYFQKDPVRVTSKATNGLRFWGFIYIITSECWDVSK